MNKKLLLSMLGMCFTLFINAQKKQVVAIDWFKATGNASSSIATGVQESVSTGFINDGRFTIIDKNKLGYVKDEQVRQQSTDALNKENAERQNKLKEIGADYVVTGVVSNYSENISKQKAYKDKNGNITGTYRDYTTKIQFTITAISIVDGTIKGKKTITESGISRKSTEEAKASAIKDIIYKTEVFIQENFPFEVNIEEISAEKKGKATLVLIGGGSAMGVKKGDLFKVVEISTLRGKTRKKEIGKLKVSAVDDENFATCKVKDGGDIILKKFNEGKELKCISLKDNGAKRLLKGFGF